MRSKLILSIASVALVLTFRNIFVKKLIVLGLSAYQVALFSGVFGLVFTFWSNPELRVKKLIEVKEPIFQLLRLIVNGLAIIFSTLSFNYLSMASIAIISKLYTPLLILFTFRLSSNYNSRQVILAIASVAVTGVFGVWFRPVGDQSVGYAFAVLALFLLLTDFAMLQRSTRSESPTIVTGVSSASYVIAGLIGCWLNQDRMLPVGPEQIIFSALLGLNIWIFYFLSIERYRLLPLGLSEFPGLVAAIFIVGADYFYFGVSLEWTFFVFLCLALAINLFILREHIYSSKPKRINIS